MGFQFVLELLYIRVCKNSYLSLICSDFSGKYIISENSKVLEVTDVQKGSDTGAYQCMSENSEGVLLKEAILKVIGKYIVIDLDPFVIGLGGS